MTVDTNLDARRREAASWFARLNQKRVAATDITAFSQWRRNPDNAAAYARIETLWEAADTLAGDADIAALTEGARGRADASRRARMRLSKVFIPIGAVAGAAVLIFGASLWFGRSQFYETGLGERRVVVLADGSHVTLDTETRIRVKLTKDQRAVELADGQAFFEVQGDRSRPFVVTAGDADVTAVGTRFDVRRSGTGAQVTLVEGKVEVRDRASQAPIWSLTPGQQVVTDATRPQVRAVDAATETSWTSGRLIFAGDTVEAATAEVNRYSRDKVVIAAPGIAQIAVSGAFNTGDVEGFVSALTELYPVVADRNSEGQIVLRDAPKTNRAVP
jgi:transmembrane sensor